MTRTFASSEELMIALLQGEKWRSDTSIGKNRWCAYVKDSEGSPFRYFMGIDNHFPISGLYKLCDGKTLWHKVEVKPKKKTVSLAMFTCYNKHSKQWVCVDVCESLQKYIEMYNDKSHFNHHKIKGSDYEIEVDDA